MLLGTFALAGALGLAAGAQGASAAGDAARGQALWSSSCAICHAPDATGTQQGPDISGAGLAAVDFQVRTGRMPRQPPALVGTRPAAHLDDAQRADLLAYLAGVVTGPAVPVVGPGDLVRGQQLYEANCGACHHATGTGGVLAQDVAVPALVGSDPVSVVEAIRTGPGHMPVFAPEQLPDADAASIATYVQELHHPADRGGLALWHLGPVTEGLVAIVVGFGALVGVIRWLGTRVADDVPQEEPPA
jgi:ubiquinol-cytochrome c reductase cytochrome c subunit